MKIVWFSGRDISENLASTTEVELTKHLTILGSKTTLISPGRINPGTIEHHSISRSRISGLQTITVVRNMRRFFEREKEMMNGFDFALVDWRLSIGLSRILTKAGLPWAIIDRGPPVTSGILGGGIRRELLRKIQKMQWRKSWKIAKEKARFGMVVSKAHSRMVKTITGRMRLNIVPSGSEVNKFGLSKSDPRELLKLAYVGRLDKKRDVSSIFQLSKSLKKSGLKHHITVAGKGDMEKIFHRKSGDIEELSYLGEISHEEVAKILAEQHVGIMPMPRIPIWEISSPIKLAEYAASGLAVIGPEHEGNILGDGGEWCILSKEENWARECVNDLLEVLGNGSWEEEIVQKSLAASRNYSWQKVAARMSNVIEYSLNI